MKLIIRHESLIEKLAAGLVRAEQPTDRAGAGHSLALMQTGAFPRFVEEPLWQSNEWAVPIDFLSAQMLSN